MQFLSFCSDNDIPWFSLFFKRFALFPIKVKMEEVPLIWHMVEVGLIVSYER